MGVPQKVVVVVEGETGVGAVEADRGAVLGGAEEGAADAGALRVGLV